MVIDDFTDEGSTILQNFDNYLPLNTVYNPNNLHFQEQCCEKLKSRKLTLHNKCAGKIICIKSISYHSLHYM
jgi:hypothetical protein